MRSPASVNARASNFSALKMRSFVLRNLTNVILQKSATPPALDLINTPISYLSRPNERKPQKSHQAKIKQRQKKQNTEQTKRNAALARCVHERERADARRKLCACLWLQYRFYTAQRKRKLCLKLQRRLGDLSAAGVILALWLLWLFRYRGHGEAEGSKMQLS